MPIISSKGNSLPESPIRKLVPFSENAEKNNISVFYLNIGQPDIKTPQVVLDAVKNNTIEVLAYSRSEGSDEYRTKLANYYQKNDIDVNKENIIITTGGSEALLFTISTVADYGDEIIIPEPFYANYNAFSIASGVNIIPVNSTIENCFALPDISEFEKLITEKTKAILICNPGNPTGYLYSKKELEKLAKIVKKHDLFLIADEVYREFIYDENDRHYSVLNNFGLDEHAIIVDSVSKRYSMCGARVGCLVSKNTEVIATALKFAQARLSPPTYAQIASEAALETPQSYFDDVITEYKDRRDTLITELQKIDGVLVSKPKGAFYCIVQLPIEDTEDFARWLLESFNDNGETVMVAPASGFYSTPGLGKNQIRIAYVLKKDDLIRSVEIIKIALEKYKNI
ncbi:MAG: pyridoxal phosphate-dependent aminotransferase [Flavobacteriaceae bacterium]|nr:pyridoxal phosphate-dependent aminotransferase [Flavobacteriaceae bacterium]